MAKRKKKRKTGRWGYRLDIDPADTIRTVGTKVPMLVSLPGDQEGEMLITQMGKGIVLP
ncbi:MAG: hypothetical protein QGG83_02155 [Candidatus Woesearchaeota archaeon]|jgi:hypothetical protein|nr:hypothetical protein [Candidatus Woesearchaeota archaeon]MDP7182227.1 hypothetical protein [Candidatus Woesearchaeota archaeon]MDP7467972.1 hypothetical protein [Candidatus Woesearchaeota archaeon]MDP7646639.1 hypothetical protein [Candidatus Woesearchaeota archaeon]